MSHNNPRIVVSQATFDLEESAQSFQPRTYSLTSDELDYSPATKATTSPNEPSPERPWLQRVIPWAPEFVWCLLSVVILMGLVMVLSTFDGRPLPELPLGLTLNTIVAILATASRAVTVFLISQGISQMKWNQYVDHERPLINMHVFDEASRGPWGSLQMVIRTRGNILASLASFLIISSLASSTLTQSAIAYKPRLVAEKDGRAKAQYCDAYPCGEAFEGDAGVKSAYLAQLEAAAFGGLFNNNANGKLPLLSPQCQSAECRWPGIETLGVCFEMRNVTDKLNVTVSDRNSDDQINKASLLGGKVFLEEQYYETADNSGAMVNVTILQSDAILTVNDSNANPIVGDPTFPYQRTSLAFNDQKQLLNTTFSHIVLVFNNYQAEFARAEQRYRAVEVLLHFCVQSLNVTVEHGEPSVKSVKSYTHISRVNEGTMSIEMDGKVQPWYYEMSSEDDKTKYKVLEYLQLDKDLQRAFAGFYASSTRSSSESPVGQFTRQIGLEMFSGKMGTSPEESDQTMWENLDKILGRIATGMTNFMRESGRERNGTAFNSVTFVEVRWEWLTLVAAQSGLTLVFLLAVVIGTARLGVDVVKSSNMAELFALPTLTFGDDSREGTKLRTQDHGFVHKGIKTEVGKDVGAVLRKGSEGWRLEVQTKDAGVWI